MTNEQNISPDGSPADDISAELDRLNAACLAAPGDVEPQIALWRYVAGLGYWYFFNRGTLERPSPFAVAADAGNMVCIYSSPDRVKEAAEATGLMPADGSLQVLSVPMPAALDWVVSFGAAGVVGATLDHPQIGAWTPLVNLPRFRQDPAPSA